MEHRICDNRIETILSLVEKTSVIADIGCDHGYVTRELLERGLAQKVIASDKSKASLLKAKNLHIEKNHSQQIEFRLGNGLDILELNEANGVIIAGMGALEIMRILTDHFEKIKKINYFIFCPHNNSHVLRKFLAANGFITIREVLSFNNNHFYECIKARFDGNIREISDFDAEISSHLIENNDILLKPFLNYKITQLNNIFSKTINYKKYSNLQKKMCLKNKLEELVKCL